MSPGPCAGRSMRGGGIVGRWTLWEEVSTSGVCSKTACGPSPLSRSLSSLSGCHEVNRPLHCCFCHDICAAAGPKPEGPITVNGNL